MMEIYIDLGLVAAGVLGIAFVQRERAKLAAENTGLRDALLEKTGDAKIEKLQDKLSEDQKSGGKSEADFESFRANNPDLFPPDGKS